MRLLIAASRTRLRSGSARAVEVERELRELDRKLESEKKERQREHTVRV